MEFKYDMESCRNLQDAESHRFILGNGIGGWMAATAAFSVNRADDSLLCAAVQIPNHRRNIVHRLQEQVRIGDEAFWISSQRFADGKPEENGYQYLNSFRMDAVPVWEYKVQNIRIRRQAAIEQELNTSVICYEFCNEGDTEAEFTAVPSFLWTDKGGVWTEPKEQFPTVNISSGKDDESGRDRQMLSLESAEGAHPGFLMICTDGICEAVEPTWEKLAYPEDETDGRPEASYAGQCCRIHWILASGEHRKAEICFQYQNSDSHSEEQPKFCNKISSRAGSPLNKKSDVIEKSTADHKDYSEKNNQACSTHISAWDILAREVSRRAELLTMGHFAESCARELSRASDLYLTQKASVNGYTLMAGYPFFGDWGRDTMISLPGCMLSTGRFAEAKSILQTFLAYEKDGLVPNLFPENGNEPMYNSVDAPLLLIETIWRYAEKTGDREFLMEALPILERIVESYRRGTHFAIGMDDDGLIRAGEGLAQVTWMDVCVNGVLPTPRHGKPVEINAYWYNALRIMEQIESEDGRSEKQREYAELAEKVKVSFREKFWMPEKGYLKDVLSDASEKEYRKDVISENSEREYLENVVPDQQRQEHPENVPVKKSGCPDEQLRCNQIWALTLSYTMLDREQENSILDVIRRELYTDHGLRTLSPKDPEYHGSYGGQQFERDMAYHQGTVWVFPMGAYYRAVLKCGDYSEAAKTEVREGLAAVKDMLEEGCAGQLPEIYDGDHPEKSKGCYAQAWSVGEILRVYEELECR